MPDTKKNKSDFINYSRVGSLIRVNCGMEWGPPSVVRLTPQWPTEAERISQGKDPYRDSMQPVVHNSQKEAAMAEKKGWLGRFVNKIENVGKFAFVGAVAGLALSFVPVTIVAGVGCVGGAVFGWFRKKDDAKEKNLLSAGKRR